MSWWASYGVVVSFLVELVECCKVEVHSSYEEAFPLAVAGIPEVVVVEEVDQPWGVGEVEGARVLPRNMAAAAYLGGFPLTEHHNYSNLCYLPFQELLAVTPF